MLPIPPGEGPKLYSEEFNTLFGSISDLQDGINTLSDKVNKGLSNLIGLSNDMIDVMDQSYDNDRSFVDSQNNLLDSRLPQNPLNQLTIKTELAPSHKSFMTRMSDQFTSLMTKIHEGITTTNSEVKSLIEVEKDQNDNDLKEYVDNSKAIEQLKTAVVGAIANAALNVGSAYLSRVSGDVQDMVNSRNHIMYEYGLDDTSGGIAKADELYKRQFDFKAMPWQERTAPEYRRFVYDNEMDAINLGYNTEESVARVTEELVKWNDVFESIDMKSQDLFNQTMKYVDQTGQSFNEIMTQVETLSTDYVVTPELLMQVSSGYSKYLRTVTTSSTQYVNSMNNLVESVAKLEDKGVETSGLLNEIQGMAFSTQEEYANSGMMSRFAMLGINPEEAYMMSLNDPGALLEMEADAIKSRLGDADLSTYAGAQQLMYQLDALGFKSPEERRNIYALLTGQSSAEELTESGVIDYTGQLKTINDNIEKLNRSAEFFESEEEKQKWSYVSPKQKFQAGLSKWNLNSPLGKFMESYEESALSAVLPMDSIINGVTDIAGTLITYKMLGKLGSAGGGKLGGLLKTGASKLAGTKLGQSAITKLAGSKLAQTGIGKFIAGKLGGSAASTALTTVAGDAAVTAAGDAALAGGGEMLGTATAATGSSLLVPAATVGGTVLGVAGAGKGIYRIYEGATDESLSDYEKKDKYWQGGTALGAVGSGAALGAAIGSIVPGLGTALGAAIGAGVGGITALAGGTDKAGSALHGMFEDNPEADAAEAVQQEQEVSATVASADKLDIIIDLIKTNNFYQEMLSQNIDDLTHKIVGTTAYSEDYDSVTNTPSMTFEEFSATNPNMVSRFAKLGLDPQEAYLTSMNDPGSLMRLEASAVKNKLNDNIDTSTIEGSQMLMHQLDALGFSPEERKEMFNLLSAGNIESYNPKSAEVLAPQVAELSTRATSGSTGVGLNKITDLMQVLINEVKSGFKSLAPNAESEYMPNTGVSSNTLLDYT